MGDKAYTDFMNPTGRTKTRVVCAVFAGFFLALSLPILAFNGVSFVAIAPYMGASLVIMFSGLLAHYMSRLGALAFFVLCLLVLVECFWQSDLPWPIQAVAATLLFVVGQGVIAVFQYHSWVPKSGLKMPTKLRRWAGCAWIVLLLQLGGIAVLAQFEMRLMHGDLATNPVVVQHLGTLEWVALDWFDLRRDRLVHLHLVGSKAKASAFVEVNTENIGPKYLGTLKFSGQEFDLTPTLYVP